MMGMGWGWHMWGWGGDGDSMYGDRVGDGAVIFQFQKSI